MIFGSSAGGRHCHCHVAVQGVLGLGGVERRAGHEGRAELHGANGTGQRSRRWMALLHLSEASFDACLAGCANLKWALSCIAFVWDPLKTNGGVPDAEESRRVSAPRPKGARWSVSGLAWLGSARTKAPVASGHWAAASRDLVLAEDRYMHHGGYTRTNAQFCRGSGGPASMAGQNIEAQFPLPPPFSRLSLLTLLFPCNGPQCRVPHRLWLQETPASPAVIVTPLTPGHPCTTTTLFYGAR